MQVQPGTVLILTSILLLSAKVTAQNLVPNYSFEVYSSCPNGFGFGGDMDCDPWFNANDATADYYNACSNNWLSDVPINYEGTQDPVTGVAYIGILAKFGPAPLGWMEYPEVELTTPLEFGQGYHVSFYVNLSPRGCAISHLGAYFSVGPVEEPTTSDLSFTPQVESNIGWLNDTLDWMLIEGCFVALGGEDHITLGNFHSYLETATEPCNAPFPTTSYYFIDDVSVTEAELTGLDLELGDDVITCYEHTIIPDVLGDVHYLWSDGSTGSSLTVNTSGTYKLTIYDDQCNGAKDSIEVTITNQPPVAFNPGDTLICSNAPLLISLDPGAGDYEWNDGSTSPQYTITTSGHYAVTLDDGCDLTTDEIDVEVMDPPAAFTLGIDTILCAGTEFEIILDPELGDFTWQDGSHFSSFLIDAEGTYALTISNMCGEESASVLVEGLTAVNVNVGPPEAILCNNETLEIFLDPTYATYEWQDGSSDYEYLISSAGVYTVTMTHPCGTSVDSVIVYQLPVLDVELGDSLFACPGEMIFLTAPGMVGDYTWQDGSTNDSILVTSSAVYALTVVNPCGTDHDSIIVQFGDLLLPVNLGADVSLCPGEQLTLHSGNDYGTHLWQDGSTADSLVVTGTGDYHVTVSNACFVFSDTIHVDVGNDPPMIDLPSQVVLCQGTSTSLEPGVSGVTYLWSDGSAAPTLAISSPGIFSLTVSNACGMDADTVVVIDGGPLPAVDIGGNLSLCPGDTIDVQPVFMNVETWTWHDGSASSSFSMTDAGMVSINVANSCGMSGDTLLVSILQPAPSLDLGADTSVCDGASVTLFITNTGTSILWNDGSTNSTLTIQQPGTYYATVANACGADSDTFQLSLIPAIPMLDLGPDLPLCPGESITLIPGIEGVDYIWQNGSTDTFYLINSPQMIVLAISNACGMSLDTLTSFSSTDGPEVDLGADQLACEGENVTIDANVSGVNYLWQDGSMGSTLLVNTSGLYAVTVSNSCGTDMDTIDVIFSGTPPDPELGADTVLCEGTTLALVSGADAETMITWQDGSGLPVFVVNTPGIYSLHEQNRCGEKSDSITIAYQSLPQDIDLGPDTTLCPGDSLLLSGPLTQDTYHWQDGSSVQTYQAVLAGTYVLTIHNACGMTSDTLDLRYDEQLPQFPAEDHFTFCAGESVTLDGTQSFPVTYAWSNLSELPVITVTTPGVYSLTIMTDCVEQSNDFVVEEKSDCDASTEIFIPNIFSPNGDQINDVFGLFPAESITLKSVTGSLFDRWGNLVFQSSAIPFTWDGKLKDGVMMSGVYVYVFQVTYQVENNIFEKTFSGDLTLMR